MTYVKIYFGPTRNLVGYSHYREIFGRFGECRSRRSAALTNDWRYTSCIFRLSSRMTLYRNRILIATLAEVYSMKETDWNVERRFEPNLRVEETNSSPN